MSDIYQILEQHLTSDDILRILRSVSAEQHVPFVVSGRAQRTKSLLINRVLSEDDPRWLDALIDHIMTKDVPVHVTQEVRRARNAARLRAYRKEKHRAKPVIDTPNQHGSSYPIKRLVNEQDLSKFLDIPSDAEVVECFRKFYSATCNEAFRAVTCAVCARSRSLVGDGVTKTPLNELPNRDRLRPETYHAAHVLTDGCLLEREGCLLDEKDGWILNICSECHTELKKKEYNKPPKYSLANGLWIGQVPWDLQHLTIAEQLLIARVYPRVFVIKLSPKSNARFGLDNDQLQSAMKGNVTSFELNPDAIGDMISGNLMPQLPSVLANTMSVTFIGRGKIPNPAALKLFRVRRHVLVSALKWLRENNTKYYGDIVIDESRLDMMPEDGVPQEIMVNIRHVDDVATVIAETDGYVPMYDEDDDEDRVILNQSSAYELKESSEPDVVPLQYLGVMDNDITKIPSSDLMTWGLRNLYQRTEEDAYAVRHGAPVSTFGQPPAGAVAQDPDRPNFWERAFPLLYPYGVGGIERDRPVKVSLVEHARWSMCYWDRRFRLHGTYIFVAYSILQRRQTFSSARIEMNRRDFDATAHILSTITPEDLRQAADEEEKGLSLSNHAVRVLKNHMHATSRRVIGSDAARFQLRNQIWSTTVYLNPPSLWMTINPDDLHDPIAQIFAGEDIDMDDFVRTAGPDKNRRSHNIASDPFAAARFFNFIITLMLECLFGIKSTPSRIYSTMGLLGHIRAYFGTVECQGRGTLHLHMLVWLANAPSPEQMKELLRTPEFRDKVSSYLHANVRSYMPELATTSHLKVIQTDAEVAYSRLPDPYSPPDEFHTALRQLETQVVRTKQIHACVFGRCLRLDRHGQLTCKRRAPWDISDSDVVHEDGTYATKRTLGYLNGYCPAVSVSAKCNNDIKLLLNGSGTNNITYYVTSYIAKKQGKSYNTSGLLADRLLWHFDDTLHIERLRDRQRMLILRAVNVLNREQEMAAPLAMSYLMGWGDVYRSHNYSNIYWGTFLSMLKREFPEFTKNTQDGRVFSESDNLAAGVDIQSTTEDKLPDCDNDTSDQVVLQFDHRGGLCPKSQIDDYMYRGDATAGYSVLDYFVDTYEQSKSVRKSRATRPGVHVPEQLDTNDLDIQHESEQADTPRVTGRPAHLRIDYSALHPRFKTHYRVLRSTYHNTLPNFIGPRFPRRADPDQADLYAASVLTLLKPWRAPSELRGPGQSWTDAFDTFIANADQRTCNVASSMDHYHACKSAADTLSADIVEDVDTDKDLGDADDECAEMLGSSTDLPVLKESNITEEMIAAVAADGMTKREFDHCRDAVHIGQINGVFDAEPAPLRQSAEYGTSRDVANLKIWQNSLQQLVRTESSEDTSNDGLRQDTGGVLNISSIQLPLSAGDVVAVGSEHESIIPPAAYSQLFPEQRRAFDIVSSHLSQTIHAMHSADTPDAHRAAPKQLLMLLIGEGGTGKSKVIQTITAEFEKRHMAHLLMKSAYTGIAASLIGGKTTHSIGSIPVNGNALTDKGKQKLAHMWSDIKYLIIDECSMISKTFLAQLSRNIAIAKMQYDSSVGDMPFGGVHVVMCGDSHQFPPVATSPNNALYHPNQPEDTTEMCLGRSIYEKFQKTVLLTHQVRVQDAEWRSFLGCLRVGQVKQQHISMLRSITLTNPTCVPTDFRSNSWRDVSLITPRHSVRTRWNNAAVTRHCQHTGRQLFMCPANDTISNRALTMVERYTVAKSRAARGGAQDRRDKNTLPDQVPLAVGMEVMVTMNVEIDLDIANGTRGIVVGIMLDPHEPPFDSSLSVVTLIRLPIYILVHLAATRRIHLAGLEPGVVPIVPASKSFRITMMVLQRERSVSKVTKNVRRLQFPITPAYAFTDYRSQGQTIKSAIVDIATPPSGGPLSMFNLYVALSRSSGRDSIRLLRDFNPDLLMRPVNHELSTEDKRLREQNASTQIWWRDEKKRLNWGPDEDSEDAVME